MGVIKNSHDIVDRFRHLDLDEESLVYLRVQSKRYARLLDIISEIRAGLRKESATLLDVGPSYFTQLLTEQFPGDSILSLGYDSMESRGGHFPEGVKHDSNHFYRFDLNNSQDPDRWIEVPATDIVILGEVIEHLYSAPASVLGFIGSFLKPGGSLVIQTPNAARLVNRIALLIGRNPYEQIRENRDNPGHFREYTSKELLEIAAASGYVVERCEIRNYFAGRSWVESLYICLNSFMPASFRDGITLLLRKRGQESQGDR